MSTTSADAPLTDRQQRMMAYVDGELAGDERRRFEAELAEDRALAVEVAGYMSLCDLTASMREMEPADHEMRRFWAKFYNRGEWRLGWLLVAVGGAMLVGFGIEELIRTEAIALPIKIAILSIAAGALLLLINTIRFKVRTHQFDRYRGVLR